MRKIDHEPRDVENENLFEIWSCDEKMAHQNIVERSKHWMSKQNPDTRVVTRHLVLQHGYLGFD